MKTNLLMVIFVWLTISAWADLDWGGGATRFLGEDGVPLTSETGIAVLVATSGAGMIDFSTIGIEERFSLVTPGALIGQGSQTHRIVALSAGFVSGYLLNTLVEDLSKDQLEFLGVAEGQRLSVIVWDRRAFRAGIPSRNSKFSTLPLFRDGASSSPALAFGISAPDPVSVIYPSREHEATVADTRALFPSPIILSVRPGQQIQFVFPSTNGGGDSIEFSASGVP